MDLEGDSFVPWFSDSCQLWWRKTQSRTSAAPERPDMGLQGSHMCQVPSTPTIFMSTSGVLSSPPSITFWNSLSSLSDPDSTKHISHLLLPVSGLRVGPPRWGHTFV